MLKTILVRLLPERRQFELWLEQGLVQDGDLSLTQSAGKIWWILFITGNLLQMAQKAILLY